MREWWLHESLCCLLPPPPSRSNSLTSLLPSSYPPRWFPMGLQLIQLSEHTNTICFELFLSQSFTPQLGSCAKVVHFSSKKKSPKNLWVKREKKKYATFSPFKLAGGENQLDTSELWKWKLGETKVTISAAGKWIRGGKEGRIRKPKRWKGGRSSESPSEVVLGCASALFTATITSLPLVAP